MVTVNLALFLLFGSFALATLTPKKCCLPNSWHANMTDTIGINTANVEFYWYYSDYEEMKIAMQHFTQDSKSGFVKDYRIVTDYQKKRIYTVTPSNCTSHPHSISMSPPCIPENAEYIGSSYIGGLPGNVTYDSWRFTHDTLTITIAIVRGSCAPVIEGIKGPNIEKVFFFSGLSFPIKDKSVFSVPKGC